VLVPAGGSLPVLAGFAARGIPAVLTGFGTLDSRVHAADESIRLDCLDLAVRAARELYRGLGTSGGPAIAGRCPVPSRTVTVRLSVPPTRGRRAYTPSVNPVPVGGE
jgi:hypothetical protein